ncbi:MAG: TetR family transcriptional regulator [Flammeovirgaceae bacterium]|nr:TetR family transcriptional regulator [Flammeovirgaceae bacterium]
MISEDLHIMTAKVVSVAEDLFMRLGIRSITMDEVARTLSMSKKTLYQYFENKDQLVSATMIAHIEREKEAFKRIHEASRNAIEEIHGLAEIMRKNLGQLNPSTLFDIQRFHPHAWETFLDFKDKCIQGHTAKNIIRGINEGYYRSEIDANIMATLRVEQVSLMFKPSVFSSVDFDFKQVQLQVLDHFIHGLLTEKGRKLYGQFYQEVRSTKKNETL